MKYIKNTTDFTIKNTAVALGKFDGLHKGHQTLISKVLDLRNKGCNSCIFTFDLSPMKVLGHGNTEAIYTNAERASIARELGVDYLIEYPFTKEFSKISPEEFVRDILVKKLDVKFIVVGKDFKFGKDRAGNVNTLKELSDIYGYTVIDIDKIADQSNIISSSLIREYIKKGEIKEVSNLLGRPYSMSGLIVYGRQLGRTIGFPTININPDKGKVIPPNGVYKTQVLIDGKMYNGVSNIGTKPTVQDSNIINLETHIIDFESNLYGKEVKIFFLDRIREERKFDSLDELKKQLQKDINASR